MRVVQKIALLTVLFLILVGAINKSYAQQDPLYTQYVDNLLMVNPGYAGTNETGKFMVVGRSQWVSFDGAPETRTFSYNTAIDEKNVGFGISVLSDKIGPIKNTGVFADYSYLLQVSDNFTLGLGIKGGVSFYRANLSELDVIDPDPIFNNDIYENFLPNVGVGFFLYSDNTYVGISAPQLIENVITHEGISIEYVNRQQIHLYVNAGHQFNFEGDFQLKASSMFRWVHGAPSSIDLSAMVGFKERIWVGGMYRFDAAYGFVAQLKPTPKMTIGYAHDITTSELSGYANVTHEIMFSYDLDLFVR